MELAEVKDRLKAIENAGRWPFVLFHTFDWAQRPLHLALTGWPQEARKKGRRLAVPRNAGDPEERTASTMTAWSVRGRDGVLLMDRDFRPPNEMMGAV